MAQKSKNINRELTSNFKTAKWTRRNAIDCISQLMLPTSSSTMASDDFIYPSQNHTAKKMKLYESQPILTSNQFDQFSNASNDADMEETININPRTSNKPYRPTFHQKIKPVIIHGKSNEEIQRLISKAEISKDITYAKKRNAFHVITTNKDDKTKLINLLKEEKIEFNSFTEPSDRHNNFVLLNHFHMKPEELLIRLKEANVPATNARFLKEDKENPLFVIQFEKNTTLKILNSNHSIINKLRIQWENLHNRNKKPSQCKRCQRFGHSAVNCGRPYRCVKCTDNHEPGQCKRLKENQDSNPGCVNCNTLGHTSNSPTCPHFVQYKNSIAAKKKTAPAPRKFSSTPAPWNQHQQQNFNLNERLANSEFPNLNRINEPYAHSSSRVNYTVNERQSFPQSKSNTRETIDFFGLQKEMNEIPDIREVVSIVRDVFRKMAAAETTIQRAVILCKFLTTESCN